GKARDCGVVFLHGWAGCRVGPHRLLVHAARRFAAAGFPSLRFDFRGRGDSGGEVGLATLTTMMADAGAAAELLQREAGVARLVLTGLCSGAEVAIGCCRRAELAGLALWSVPPVGPGSSSRLPGIGRVLGGYLRKALRPESWRKLLRGRVHVSLVAKAIGGQGAAQDPQVAAQRAAEQVALLSDLRASRTRLFLAHGSCDPVGRKARTFYMALDRSLGWGAEFIEIAGADHNFYDAALKEELLCHTLAWLEGL
ncbi:MAG: alpha/beta fold hydrolase, partial [Planctomycetes bacterium]|nr:alpha/beta fold hydrolase [Planctomycetota bacterium]